MDTTSHPNEVIDQVHRLARKTTADRGLLITDRHGHPLADNPDQAYDADHDYANPHDYNEHDYYENDNDYAYDSDNDIDVLPHGADALNNYPDMNEPIANEINQDLPPPLILPGIPYPGPAPIAGVLDHGDNIIDLVDEEDDNIPPIEEGDGNMDPDGIEANVPKEPEPEEEEPEPEEAEPEGNMRGGHNLRKYKPPSYAHMHAMDAIDNGVYRYSMYYSSRFKCFDS
jgi:hypothetical protein